MSHDAAKNFTNRGDRSAGHVLHRCRFRRLSFVCPDSPPKTYSEETAHEIDEEVKELVNKAHEKAKSIVQAKKRDIERIAKILQEKEA